MSKHKFQVGDKVIVTRTEEDYKACLGAIGEIVDVDPNWEFPYEVVLEDKELRGYQELGQMQELFEEAELSLIPDVQINFEDPKYVVIKFQEGTVEEVGVNGVQIEDIIDILVERLQGFQNGGFPCRENALAITHLQEAQNWLYRRTMERKKQGVEGKYVKHK
jgi:hypothetical protein